MYYVPRDLCKNEENCDTFPVRTAVIFGTDSCHHLSIMHDIVYFEGYFDFNGIQLDLDILKAFDLVFHI